MSKFNTGEVRAAAGRGPLTAEATPTARTYEGAPGYARDLKSELFLLAVTNFVGEDTFYETAVRRDERFQDLVRRAALTDPVWTARMLRWLRYDGNMRSASLVGALEFVQARLGVESVRMEDGRGVDRWVVDAVMRRADEPGEALAYWFSHHGRTLPKAVKRGVADAALRLYTEYPLLKYDTGSHAVRFADVLELTHPGDGTQRNRRRGEWQRDLFTHALDRRAGRLRANVRRETPETLAVIRANAELRRLADGNPEAFLDTERLRAAGMTWEDVLSLVGSKVEKGKLWSALVPLMGYDALLKNLRNLDETGVSDEVARSVIERLTDPVAVRNSRQLPYRFLAAYENAPSLRWGHPLDVALRLSLVNLPVGLRDSLVLIDTSASMTNATFSRRSTMTAAKAAAVFGVALAAGVGADLYGFADGQFRHDVPAGASVIREVEKFVRRTGEVGHGTYAAHALRATLKRDHKRVFIISDEQTADGNVTGALPADVALYTFNLSGYGPAMTPAGARANRHQFGGLTDAMFKLVPLLEAGRNAAWPWEKTA